MSDSLASLWFAHALRSALQHLWDPTELRKSALVDLFELHQHKDPVRALRHLLVEAIESVKPAGTVPSRSNAWRTYHILSHHFVEQQTQHEVASDLGLSTRQLQRHERLALQVLADYLATRYDLNRLPGRKVSLSTSAEADFSSSADASTREQELAWLQRSVPSGPTDVGDVLQAALQVVAPLAHILDVRVDCQIPENLLPIAAQPIATRQALLIVLTVAIRHVPGGQVRIGVEKRGATECVGVHSLRQGASTSTLTKEDVQPLEMAQQLIALSGGSLEVSADDRSPEPFIASLTLPVVGQVPVLVVDDNTEVLELFRRYLAGSRYRIVGVSDPRHVLSTAEELAAHIIVMDVMLPGIDGWELLGRLRAHPKTYDVPVVICTILPQEQLALALGAAAFIGKPFSRQALLSVLDHQLGLLSREHR